MSRFSVFVDAEEGDVEVVPRIGEIVGISAKERDIKLGRKYQADIGVLFVFIQVVDLAGVEDDNVAAQASGSRAVLFHVGHSGALSLSSVRSRHSRLHACIDLLGYVFNLDQLVQFQVGAFRLFGLVLRVKAGFDVIMSARRQLLHALGADMVIGESETVRGNERTGAAVVKANR